MPTLKELRIQAESLGIPKAGRKPDLERRIVAARVPEFVESFGALTNSNEIQDLLGEFSDLWFKTPSKPVKRLREQLSQYGLSKTGKKEVLVRRIAEVRIPEFIKRTKLAFNKPKKFPALFGGEGDVVKTSIN